MSFEDVAVDDVKRLKRKFDSYQGENQKKARFYDGKHRARDLGISIPPHMRDLDAIVGWPAMAVDVLEERLDFEGWTDPAFESIYAQNDLDVKAPTLHVDALMYGVGYVTVTTGDVGEPSVSISVASPTEMVGTRDTRTNLLNEAVQFYSLSDVENSPLGAVLFRPNETVWLEQVEHKWAVTAVDQHRLGRVPVAEMVNKARASKQGGRSEITPAVRSLTESAMRTLLGAEVAREFYAVPQRYMMGAPESFFLDDDGNPRGAWDAMMGKILAIERDEDGQVPQVGHFPANQMTPFFQQVQHYAQLLSAETAIPASYLGFTTDNPASADAIRMSENRLVKRAERRQAMFGKTWTEVARLALMVRDGRSFSQLTDEELAIRPMWRDASTPTKAAAMDQVTKGIAAGVYTPDGDYVLKALGLSPQDRRMVKNDRRASVAGTLKRLEDAKNVSPEAQALVSRPKPEESAGGVNG